MKSKNKVQTIQEWINLCECLFKLLEFQLGENKLAITQNGLIIRSLIILHSPQVLNRQLLLLFGLFGFWTITWFWLSCSTCLSPMLFRSTIILCLKAKLLFIKKELSLIRKFSKHNIFLDKRMNLKLLSCKLQSIMLWSNNLMILVHFHQELRRVLKLLWIRWKFRSRETSAIFRIWWISKWEL